MVWERWMSIFQLRDLGFLFKKMKVFETDSVVDTQLCEYTKNPPNSSL
jgi:hypothetical protein